MMGKDIYRFWNMMSKKWCRCSISDSKCIFWTFLWFFLQINNYKLTIERVLDTNFDIISLLISLNIMFNWLKGRTFQALFYPLIGQQIMIKFNIHTTESDSGKEWQWANLAIGYMLDRGFGHCYTCTNKSEFSGKIIKRSFQLQSYCWNERLICRFMILTIVIKNL